MSKKVEGELGRIGAILLWVILLFLWATTTYGTCLWPVWLCILRRPCWWA